MVLQDKYPEILEDVSLDIPDTWNNLVDVLCQKIQQFHTENPTYTQTKCVQIKEKFGQLRFYIESGYPEVFNLISIAEKQSSKICQNCGCAECEIFPTKGWIMYLCEPCIILLNKTKFETTG